MARNIDSGRLSVMLWGQEIGQLCWNPAKGNSYFFFSPEYLSSGLDIAPLTASSKSPAARFAIYGNTDSAKYQKLPPFIADSLPDDWGNTLFDQWFAEHHYHEKDKTPLAKLSFVGSRAMGALEFVPCSEDAFSTNEKLMIPKLYDLAKKIEQDREHAIISPEETLTQKALMAVGTSAGGPSSRWTKVETSSPARPRQEATGSITSSSSIPPSSASLRSRKPGMTWPPGLESR